jgi:hypothetical protein
MWQDLEARLKKYKNKTPLYQALLPVIKASGLTSIHSTDYAARFDFGEGERLVWEVRPPARNFYLHIKWREQLEKSGLQYELRPYPENQSDDGRFSALNSGWAFGQSDCIATRIDSAGDLSRLLGVLLENGDELKLDQAVITRWIERLRQFFPDLDRFNLPDPAFDAAERAYKLETAATLKDALEQASSDQDYVDAVHTALAGSNLLDWRTYWPISPKGTADRDRLWPAIRTLAQAALSDPGGHPKALEEFVEVWMSAVPEPTADPARQIAEFLFMHLAPDHGFYIRSTVRQALWREAVGTEFPSLPPAETYATELKFARAVHAAFEARGLAPRDLIDIQSALWVIHSYKDDPVAWTTPAFSREAIEAAMDAFEAYQADGSHSDLFSAFGVPQDYWVRSTRQRKTAAFPSKPIVGYLLKKTTLNGGWAQKHDAAARLHNAGYVIVDRDGAPVPLPPAYEHLQRGADRIRVYALNYFIEPAREQNAAEVSVAARTVAVDLGLQNDFPSICSALGGVKFQELAGVGPPRHTGPNPSSTTIFTYRLSGQEASQIMQPEHLPVHAAPTNLILYGPPGTGKTYATALEAVRLCLGADAAAQLAQDRTSLMRAYRELAEEGRIEFVTFHQSFSYEEFVEGLRPVTGTGDAEDEAGPAPSGGGFSLKAHDGAFKRISERARLDRSSSSSERLDRSNTVFKITLGRRGEQEERIREGLDKSLIHLGWGGAIDWSDPRYEAFDEILSAWQAHVDPSATGYNSNVAETWAFRSHMQVGDYVVLADGRDRFRALGQVTGEYYFDGTAAFHPHRRKVNWIWQNDAGEDRSRFYAREFSRKACFKLRSDLIDWDSLERIVFGSDKTAAGKDARDFVLIIDEINRANISKVFGELITLIETDKRLGATNELRLTLPYSGMKFGVPSNLHIIGTMNTADRSIALLDTALRRRFTFRELMPDPGVLESDVDGINLQRLLSTLNDRIEYLFDREHQIGHAYFTACRTRTEIEDVLRHRIIPLLAEYFYEDWSKVAAVLGDNPNSANPRFLRCKVLTPPDGIGSDDLVSEKLRWEVKDTFDLSEFDA